MRNAEHYARELSADETNVVAGGVTSRAVMLPTPNPHMDGMGNRETTYSPEDLAELAAGAAHQALRKSGGGGGPVT
jgi:hypothetical protein